MVCFPSIPHHFQVKSSNLNRFSNDSNELCFIDLMFNRILFLFHVFLEFFKNLLSQSKSEFHDMFKRTYGVIYEQNSYVFSDLFNDLESYYLRGNVDLTEALDRFFNVLYQKMFIVLNSQYKFDDA